MARAINDVGLIRRLVAQGTRTIVVLLFSSAVAFSFMFAQSPSLTLLLLPPMPLIFGIAYLMSRRLYRESMAVQRGFSDLSDRVQENLGGIRTIQALNQEEYETRLFRASNQEYLERNMSLLRTNSLLASFMPGLGALAILVVLYFGGLRVMAGEITLGTFTAFVWYLNMVLWPVREAGNMISLLQRGAAGCVRLFELLDAEPEIADRPAPDAPERLEGGIELRGVTYRYPEAAAATLVDVSLRIEPGENVAVLGRIGSGKSTLLHLLVRFLEPAPDTVFLDGVDSRNYPLGRLRSQVVLVPQEPFLFSESVSENVSYDAPDRERELLAAAAEAADLDGTIADFPYGWETQVGERGVLLSGGQKQRLTLARGFVRDAPLLLLDDPFSSVDSETEERILARMVGLRRGRTTVIVTHRVAAARAADRVVVLERGRIVESGTPKALREKGGAYAKMERTQRRTEALLQELDEEDGVDPP